MHEKKSAQKQLAYLAILSHLASISLGAISCAIALLEHIVGPDCIRPVAVSLLALMFLVLFFTYPKFYQALNTDPNATTPMPRNLSTSKPSKPSKSSKPVKPSMSSWLSYAILLFEIYILYALFSNPVQVNSALTPYILVCLIVLIAYFFFFVYSIAYKKENTNFIQAYSFPYTSKTKPSKLTKLPYLFLIIALGILSYLIFFNPISAVTTETQIKQHITNIRNIPLKNFSTFRNLTESEREDVNIALKSNFSDQLQEHLHDYQTGEINEQTLQKELQSAEQDFCKSNLLKRIPEIKQHLKIKCN